MNVDDHETSSIRLRMEDIHTVAYGHDPCQELAHLTDRGGLERGGARRPGAQRARRHRGRADRQDARRDQGQLLLALHRARRPHRRRAGAVGTPRHRRRHRRGRPGGRGRRPTAAAAADRVHGRRRDARARVRSSWRCSRMPTTAGRPGAGPRHGAPHVDARGAVRRAGAVRRHRPATGRCWHTRPTSGTPSSRTRRPTGCPRERPSRRTSTASSRRWRPSPDDRAHSQRFRAHAIRRHS